MALQIVQHPLTDPIIFLRVPAGQQLIFAVQDKTIVAASYNVKYLAEVHVGSGAMNLSNNDNLIGTFKTTPNNEGSGIFDLRPILETFVNSDNDASTGSSYKLDADIDFPMHLIDHFALSEKGTKIFAINFRVQYSLTETSPILQSDPEPSEQYLLFNGVLQYDDVLTLDKGNYGYDLSRFSFAGDDTLQFLSNAPTTQYARITDYGTLPFFNWTVPPGVFLNNIAKVTYTFYNPAGVQGTFDVLNGVGTGGVDNITFQAKDFIMYVAAFPANLRQANAAIDTLLLVTGGDKITHYTIQLTDEHDNVSALNTVNIICPNLKGYEAVRLTWLNQWGTWDYYTFTMKSTRTISTKRIPYTQQGGTWNESTFKIKGWKGGKKNFRVNTTEKIKLNTDFVTEDEGVWFEELINSPEVYIVNEYVFERSPYDTITNKYIEPVTLTTSSYVKKTIANDKLMQYTFEIEKSKMQRTQAI